MLVNLINKERRKEFKKRQYVSVGGEDDQSGKTTVQVVISDSFPCTGLSGIS